jgi:hypothetical protein
MLPSCCHNIVLSWIVISLALASLCQQVDIFLYQKMRTTTAATATICVVLDNTHLLLVAVSHHGEGL